MLIILIDDVGYGQASTYGGEINTPNLTRIAQSGVSYNAFHNTSICSPTRAALLTGRNHHRVGSGTIAERAVDWDGYTGVIPKTSATIAEVLKDYGYKTAAFGKWHNTPADQTTAMGPFDKWPTGYGFEYFYGFLAGETSQWEPRLVENTNIIEPPNTPGYHLTEDLADHAIGWLKKHQSYTPDKPFFIYFATGGAHGPHHVAPVWTAKYKGKFDDGYEAMRERILKRQKEIGWVPQATELTRRVESMPAWNSILESERPFQLHLMETFAGFVEHTDAQVGGPVDEVERLRQALHLNHHVYLRRQRCERRGPAWFDQRIAGAEQHPEDSSPANCGLEQDRRPGCHRHPQDRQHVPRRLGLGGQHAAQIHQAGRRAFWWYAFADGDLLAGEGQAGQCSACAVPPRQ